jgi:hypothetical protein
MDEFPRNPPLPPFGKGGLGGISEICCQFAHNFISKRLTACEELLCMPLRPGQGGRRNAGRCADSRFFPTLPSEEAAVDSRASPQGTPDFLPRLIKFKYHVPRRTVN